MYAAFVGAAGVCKTLIEAGADVSRKDTTALSADALLRAAQERHVNVSSLLMDHGASPDACTSSHGVNGIWLSLTSEEDCALNVVHLLSRGISARCVNSVTGWSALHVSAAHGQHDSILPLVEYKADVRLRDRAGRTALHLAARHGMFGIVTLLARHGADIHARDKRGMTSLHLAARYGVLRTIRCLVDLGSDVHAKDSRGWTALVHACSWDESGGYQQQYETLSVTAEILRFGARVNARTRRGLTALHVVSALGRPESATQLILAGADIEARTRNGRTPLHLASMKNRLTVIRKLIEKGAGVNTFDQYGNSPLHSAAALGHVRVVQELLKLNGAVEERNNAGRSVLDVAARAGHAQVLLTVLERCTDSAHLGYDCVEDLLRSAQAAAQRHRRYDICRMIPGRTSPPQCALGKPENDLACENNRDYTSLGEMEEVFWGPSDLELSKPHRGSTHLFRPKC
jgi:uncharacterized protein